MGTDRIGPVRAGVAGIGAVAGPPTPAPVGARASSGAPRPAPAAQVADRAVTASAALVGASLVLGLLADAIGVGV